MYPLAMNRSIEDTITVNSQEEEYSARDEGYVNGHEFYSKLAEQSSELPAKSANKPIEKMNKTELTNLATDKGISVSEEMTRAQILAAISQSPIV